MQRLLKRQKGFVLMETIVVIGVLCVVLILLYASYSNIFAYVKKNSYYDNTEYLYKTAIVRSYLEESQACYDEIKNYDVALICDSSSENTYCDTNNIPACSVKTNVKNNLKVKSIYITSWYLDSDLTEIRNLPATTQLYIKSLDAETSSTFKRIIVMYEQENNYASSNKNVFEYASLRYGSRY